MRALLELVLTIIAVVVARAILSSLMRGMVNAGRATTAPHSAADNASQNNAPNGANQQAQSTGELHKDPVCGTYVAESTPFRRHASGKTFYYCSDACKAKHA
ncbi:MAG TPA: YHS domain-containing protein [Bryobacteraceae bacterium]|nr:YHS domain-containing protein [Bryobacteraceae bacterium]